MGLGKLSQIRPLSFGHKMGSRYGHLIDRAFLMGRDPYDDYWMVSAGSPPANISKKPDHYLIEIPLPGYEPDQIHVEVDNGILLISGEKTAESEPETDYILKEYDIERFERAFQLGPNTDHEHIKARFEKGVLKLELAHTETQDQVSDARHIEIE